MEIQARYCVPPWAELFLHSLRLLTLQTGELCDSPACQNSIQELAMRKVDSLYYITHHTASPEQQMYERVWSIQRRELLNVLGAFKRAGITPLVIKGAEIFEGFLGSRPISLCYDIDLLIHREEVGIAKQVLYSLGCRQGRFDRNKKSFVDYDVYDIAKTEIQHYELATFAKILPFSDRDIVPIYPGASLRPLYNTPDGHVLLLVFDIHHAIATDIATPQFFERAVPSAFEGGKTMSPADHLWFITCRYYNEISAGGKVSLRDFAYIALLIAQRDVDWESVLRAATTYDIRPSLYYFISFVSDLLGGIVPPTIITELAPSNGSRLRDWGSQLFKLLGGFENISLLENQPAIGDGTAT